MGLLAITLELGLCSPGQEAQALVPLKSPSCGMRVNPGEYRVISQYHVFDATWTVPCCNQMAKINKLNPSTYSKSLLEIIDFNF